MSRRRYIQDPITGELIERDYYTPPSEGHSAYVQGDSIYADLGRATDGAPIDSRTKHREYMRAKGLTVADDFKGQWQRQAKDRADFFTTGKDPSRKQDLVRALEQSTHTRRS